MSKNTDYVGELLSEFACPICGGSCGVAMLPGSLGILHSVPSCVVYEKLEVDEFLALCKQFLTGVRWN